MHWKSSCSCCSLGPVTCIRCLGVMDGSERSLTHGRNCGGPYQRFRKGVSPSVLIQCPGPGTCRPMLLHLEWSFSRASEKTLYC